MADLGNFNAHEVEPATQFDPLPAGKYLAVITESQQRPTKTGAGSYLQLTFQILDGPYKGRSLWSRLNLENSNPMTVQIARAELSAICRAVGVMTPKDSCELHSLPLLITVKCKTRADTGEITNEIKGYARRESSNGQPPQATSNTPPWRRSA
jgi:hypothetical protein